MGTENDISISDVVSCAYWDGKKYVPMTLKSKINLAELSTENDISEEWLDQHIIPDDMVINGTFVIKGKSKRKTFKKWLMSIGFQRNDAELICNVLGACKGKISYYDWFLLFTLGDDELYKMIFGQEVTQ